MRAGSTCGSSAHAHGAAVPFDLPKSETGVHRPGEDDDVVPAPEQVTPQPPPERPAASGDDHRQALAGPAGPALRSQQPMEPDDVVAEPPGQWKRQTVRGDRAKRALDLDDLTQSPELTHDFRLTAGLGPGLDFPFGLSLRLDA